MKTNNSGFHVIEIAVVVLVLGILGFMAFKVWQGQSPSSDSSQTAAEVAPEIKTSKDLDTATKTIDDVDLDNDLGDINKLEKELDSL